MGTVKKGRVRRRGSGQSAKTPSRKRRNRSESLFLLRQTAGGPNFPSYLPHAGSCALPFRSPSCLLFPSGRESKQPAIQRLLSLLRSNLCQPVSGEARYPMLPPRSSLSSPAFPICPSSTTPPREPIVRSVCRIFSPLPLRNEFARKSRPLPSLCLLRGEVSPSDDEGKSQRLTRPSFGGAFHGPFPPLWARFKAAPLALLRLPPQQRKPPRRRGRKGRPSSSGGKSPSSRSPATSESHCPSTQGS